MAGADNPQRNHLLASLPEPEFKRLSPCLELVGMPSGEILCESGDVYFPTTSVVSLHYVMENGASAEIAGVSMVNEGLLGILLFMGGKAANSRAFVQTAGRGYKLKARLLVEEFKHAGPIQHLLLHYTQTLLIQTSRTLVYTRGPCGGATTVTAGRERRSLSRLVPG